LTWADARTLARHFRDHGDDFGDASPREYAVHASSFLATAVREGYPVKVDKDGIIRVYDEVTNTFGAYNPDGSTRTFFKPTSDTYWKRQPGAEPWSG
jgi:pyocin large subunit-like protein